MPDHVHMMIAIPEIRGLSGSQLHQGQQTATLPNYSALSLRTPRLSASPRPISPSSSRSTRNAAHFPLRIALLRDARATNGKLSGCAESAFGSRRCAPAFHRFRLSLISFGQKM
jgi:hypothetical protein